MPVSELGKKPLSPHRYWTSYQPPPPAIERNRMIDLVRTTFIDSVKLRLRSDVPVGSCQGEPIRLL